MAILLRPFEFLAHRLLLYCLEPFSFLLANYLWLYCLDPLNFLLSDKDYVVDALSVSCSSTMTILLRPFEFIAHRLWIYCLGPYRFLLTDYGYID